MKRFMLAASLVAAISVPLTLVAQSASAGTSCTGKTAVGHGISASLCLNIAYSDSIGAVGLSGTTIWFTSNPLLIKCQVESTIYDYDTGKPASNNGATNLAQCTANADEHNTWTPNAALMAATEPCVKGHRYYAVMDIVATDVSRNNFVTSGLRTPTFVTC